jgi:N-acetylglutamate synthase-like GNAT family acetyltransferase
MTVTVTAFAPQDLDGLLAVILPIQQAEFQIPITVEDQPDLFDIPAFYQTGCGGFWVAKVDGQVVGTIGLKDFAPRQVALRKMFVAAPYRGAPWATARHLLTTALEAARAQAVEQVTLGTTAKFLAAHRFYEKNGFSEIPPADLPPAFPRMAVDSKFYRLTFAP